MSRALALAIAAAAAAMAAPQQEHAPLLAPAFSVRANPEWASAVNRALAEIAQPVEAKVPDGMTPTQFVQRLCGGRPATVLQAQDGLVHFAPCVRIDLNVSVSVTKGDTLEGLAARSGLPRTAATRVTIVPNGATAPVAATASGTALFEGDTVLIPQVPLWTQVIGKPNVIAGREAFVRALARHLSCGTLKPDECLSRRGVIVLTRASVPIARGDATPLGSLAKGLLPSLLTFEPAAITYASKAIATSEPPQLPTTVAVPVAVAPEQWPLDARLVAAIVQDAASQMSDFRPAHVGVVDGGFATKTGPPFLDGTFGDGDDLPDDNNHDDEGNDWVDDNFGAGIARPPIGGKPGESLGTGNLSFCGASPTLDVTAWPDSAIRMASHGAAVAALAAGRSVRQMAPDAAASMPKVVFFRMLGSVCDPDGDFRPTAGGEIATGYHYLSNSRRSTKVYAINVSYSVPAGDLSEQLFLAMQNMVPYYTRLLVVASGDDGLPLDSSAGCPICLGKEDRNNRSSRNTLVVGAATRHLQRASYSNYGLRTVLLYAPGEAVGAADLKGRDIPETDGATSYAAPYVTFAAGLMVSLGIAPEDVNDRLRAATWPIDAPATEIDRERAGVLDLARAAAVRHDAIVVDEAGPNGSRLLRTYVGTLDSIPALCPGQGVSLPAIHAIRLSEQAADGERVIRLYMRSQPDPNKDHVGRKFIRTMSSCRPTGTVTMKSLISGTTHVSDTKNFPIADVRAIQWRWTK